MSLEINYNISPWLKDISISEVRYNHYFNIKFDRNVIYNHKTKL